MNLQFFLQLGQLRGVGFRQVLLLPDVLGKVEHLEVGQGGPFDLVRIPRVNRLELANAQFRQDLPWPVAHGDPALVEGAVIDPDQGLFAKDRFVLEGRQKACPIQGQVFRGLGSGKFAKGGQKIKGRDGTIAYLARLDAGRPSHDSRNPKAGLGGPQFHSPQRARDTERAP